MCSLAKTLPLQGVHPPLETLVQEVLRMVDGIIPSFVEEVLNYHDDWKPSRVYRILPGTPNPQERRERELQPA